MFSFSYERFKRVALKSLLGLGAWAMQGRLALDRFFCKKKSYPCIDYVPPHDFNKQCALSYEKATMFNQWNSQSKKWDQPNLEIILHRNSLWTKRGDLFDATSDTEIPLWHSMCVEESWQMEKHHIEWRILCWSTTNKLSRKRGKSGMGSKKAPWGVWGDPKSYLLRRKPTGLGVGQTCECCWEW